jgi:hypothetical protein
MGFRQEGYNERIASHKIEKKKQILNALVEGSSIRSTERMTGCHKDTIMRLLVEKWVLNVNPC